MIIPPMRPTFEIDFPIDPETAINRLCLLLNDDDYPVTGRVAGTHLMLVIPPDRRHFWSPWLNIEVHPQSETNAEEAKIHGRFSPNPSVWTGFMLGYITLITLIFFASMFGVAQWMMDGSPTALKLIPVFVVIGGIMYWASLMGQRIANAQMHELYDASMAALAGNPIPNLKKSGSTRPDHESHGSKPSDEHAEDGTTRATDDRVAEEQIEINKNQPPAAVILPAKDRQPHRSDHPIR